MHNHTDPIDQSPLASFLQQIAEQHGAAAADPTWVFANPVAIDTLSWRKIVVIRKEHCRLMRSLNLTNGWTHTKHGMLDVGITTVHPVGTGDVVSDCADALGWSRSDLFANPHDPYPLPLREQRCLTLFADIPSCLEVVLQRGRMERGVFFQAWSRNNTFRYRKARLSLRLFDRLWQAAYAQITPDAAVCATLSDYVLSDEGRVLMDDLFTKQEYDRLLATITNR